MYLVLITIFETNLDYPGRKHMFEINIIKPISISVNSIVSTCCSNRVLQLPFLVQLAGSLKSF